MVGDEAVLRAWSLLSAEFEPSLAETVGDLTVYARKLAEHAVTLCALRGGRLAGAVSACANYPAAGAYVAQLAVAGAERGRGVATGLLGRVLSLASARGMRRVRLEVREGNGPARALYSGMGFEPTGERGRYGLIMGRSLSPTGSELG